MTRLLLHTCCADCCLKFLESAKDSKFSEITVYFYNPNIHPRSEYHSRLAAIKKVLPSDIKLIVPDWKPANYFKVVTTSKNRCLHCWQLRLSHTAAHALQNNYSHFSSTLLTSHYQDSTTVKKIGQSLVSKNLKFFIPQITCCDLKTSGFYKQFFCGCVYSLTERFEEKYQV